MTVGYRWDFIGAPASWLSLGSVRAGLRAGPASAPSAEHVLPSSLRNGGGCPATCLESTHTSWPRLAVSLPTGWPSSGPLFRGPGDETPGRPRGHWVSASQTGLHGSARGRLPGPRRARAGQMLPRQMRYLTPARDSDLTSLRWGLVFGIFQSSPHDSNGQQGLRTACPMGIPAVGEQYNLKERVC